MDVVDLATIFTDIMKRLRPAIDEDISFDLIVELLSEHQTIDNELVEHYADAIMHSADPQAITKH